MKKIIYTCDKCGAEIPDVVYSLTCYAADVSAGPGSGVSPEVAGQNMKQNLKSGVVHLCRSCKDKITDGVFIV